MPSGSVDPAASKDTASGALPDVGVAEATAIGLRLPPPPLGGGVHAAANSTIDAKSTGAARYHFFIWFSP